MVINDEVVGIIKSTALKAGSEIMRVYLSGDFMVEHKSDESPLTAADKASHELIAGALTKHFPNIPIVSEEGMLPAYDDRKKWEYFWLVDPLDGTKEFLKRNGEFTVNIALIHINKPVFGVIYAPVLKTIYYGYNGRAFKQVDNEDPAEVKVNRDVSEGITAVKSRSHSGEKEAGFLSKFNIIKEISAGSSLKFCMLAGGKADLYYRSGPTYEWDTAAGHAIVINAGGFNPPGEYALAYNKPNLLNGGFLFTSFEMHV